MSDRMEATVLGRVIGTATGWDMHDTMVFGFYDFEPADGVPLLGGQVDVNFETGKFTVYDDDGAPVTSIDLVSALAGVPVKNSAALVD